MTVNLLLDTHALLWFLADDHHLRPAARQLMADPLNDVFVSAASAWEIAIKSGLGKLAVPPDIATWLPVQLSTARLIPLPISVLHAAAVERLPPHHADPFDRLLIAQASAEHLTIVTRDPQFERYDVRLIRC
jgi:PIN domain nuclease of toxin-antitoxin system